MSSSRSACADEDGIAVTCLSWEGRYLLHLSASKTDCRSSPPAIYPPPICCSPAVKTIRVPCITLDHRVMLNLILPGIDWAVLALSLSLSELSSIGLLQWQIIVSSTAAGQRNVCLQLKQALVYYLDKTEELRHSSKWFIITVTKRVESFLYNHHWNGLNKILFRAYNLVSSRHKIPF